MKTYRLKVDGVKLGVYTMDAETEHKFKYFPDLQMIPVEPATDKERQERNFNSIMAELVSILNPEMSEQEQVKECLDGRR
jgi:hypothetical protein